MMLDGTVRVLPKDTHQKAHLYIKSHQLEHAAAVRYARGVWFTGGDVRVRPRRPEVLKGSWNI